MSAEMPPDPFALHPVERLLLGEITGWDLTRPWFDVWMLGRLSLQRELEDAEAEVRRLDALHAAPAPRNIAALLSPTFEELSRLRSDQKAEAHARRRAAALKNFGRGVA